LEIGWASCGEDNGTRRFFLVLGASTQKAGAFERLGLLDLDRMPRDASEALASKMQQVIIVQCSNIKKF
jgi:hypothetical protein